MTYKHGQTRVNFLLKVLGKRMQPKRKEHLEELNFSLVGTKLVEVDWLDLECKEHHLAWDWEVELQELEEKREVVESKIEKYHRRPVLAYNKHIRSSVFLEGDLVLKSVDAVMRKMTLPKWAPKWEGPYIVSEIHPNGHCILLDPDHGTTTSPSISSMASLSRANIYVILFCKHPAMHEKTALAIIHSKGVNDVS
ncbi:hypothetical protein Ahy_A09g043833 [Arachis hypogaea]|uniref:Uncharacterized protein n=1 Tax=Arachis hypogaea TaxID=3818 RepID=A0A445BJ33_ARAHY|nr:hypothetical protein Ahy_A09g043833 [Arachis hypogaea]